MLHVIALAIASVTVLTRPDVQRVAETGPALNVVLVQRVLPTFVEPVETEPKPTVEQPEESAPPKRVRVAENQPAPVVTAIQPDAAPVSSQLSVTPAPTLDLRRPEGWSSLATESPEERANSAFKKSTRDAIAQRKQERALSRALSRSQVARLGLPEEEYRRRTDAGEEVKTAKGCFVKRVENGLNGHSERWWRTACRDSSKPDWAREVLSFGPDHRVLPDAGPTRAEP